MTANGGPKLVAEVQNLALAGEWQAPANCRTSSFRCTRPCSPSQARRAKYAVSLLGLCSEECRLPVMPLSEATRERIRSAMQALNLLCKTGLWISLLIARSINGRALLIYSLGYNQG